MNELRRNGSGYYDPTAYKALKKIEREENEMEIKKGEIWEVEAGNSLREGIVVAVHLGYSTIILLNDEHRPERTIKLNSHGMKCADPGRVSFMQHKDFNKFIRLTTDEEFADIMKQVADALEIEREVPFGIVESKEIQRLQMELEDAKEKNFNLEQDNVRLAATIYEDEKTDVKLTILQTERDLYKSLYEQTFERLIG